MINRIALRRIMAKVGSVDDNVSLPMAKPIACYLSSSSNIKCHPAERLSLAA